MKLCAEWNECVCGSDRGRGRGRGRKGEDLKKRKSHKKAEERERERIVHDLRLIEQEFRPCSLVYISLAKLVVLALLAEKFSFHPVLLLFFFNRCSNEKLWVLCMCVCVCMWVAEVLHVCGGEKFARVTDTMHCTCTLHIVAVWFNGEHEINCKLQ